MMLLFVKRHVRVISAVLVALSVMIVGDFLLLVTSLGLHWWIPAWGLGANRVLLVFLIILSFGFALLYIFRLWIQVKVYRSNGYTLKIAQELIVCVEVLMLLILCAAWGLLVLVGQPSILPLKLFGFVWVSGFFVFAALQVYDLRCRR